jgi:hypothetical protein
MVPTYSLSFYAPSDSHRKSATACVSVSLSCQVSFSLQQTDKAACRSWERRVCYALKECGVYSWLDSQPYPSFRLSVTIYFPTLVRLEFDAPTWDRVLATVEEKKAQINRRLEYLWNDRDFQIRHDYELKKAADKAARAKARARAK